MFKQVKQVAIALAAMVTMSAPAMAATIIDFRNGPALAGGSITFDGTNVFGSNLPIGLVEIFAAPVNNGVFDVDGAIAQTPGFGDGSYGSLDFNTATDMVTLTGCVPGLGVGVDANGNCTPVVLLSGTVTGFNLSNTGGGSRVDFTGFDIKNPALLLAIGLPANTPFLVDTFALLTGTLTAGGDGVQSISTDVRNTAVPEPATMMLLGTGLLAAFRARRKQQA